MKSKKFIHYSHNPYSGRLDTPPYTLVDGEEYLLESDEWEGTGMARKVRGFRISGIFMINPDWSITMINNEGVGVPIPGFKKQHFLWFNDTKDVESYNTLLDDINESCMEWMKIK